MANRLTALRARRAELKLEARAITDAADEAGLDLTDEQNTSLDALIEQSTQLEASIEREEKLADIDAAAAIANDRSPTAPVVDVTAEDPKAGFKSFGDFAMSVHAASTGNFTDERLLIGAAAPSC